MCDNFRGKVHFGKTTSFRILINSGLLDKVNRNTELSNFYSKKVITHLNLGLYLVFRVCMHTIIL